MSRIARSMNRLTEDLFRAGRIQANYDAATPNRFRRSRAGVPPLGAGADYHIRSAGGYYGMIELARELDRNNPFIGQGLNRFVNNVIQSGISYAPDTGDEAIDNDLRQWWTAISEDPDEMDISGEMTFLEIEQLVTRQTVLDGDILALPTRHGPLELVEAHRLKTPANTRLNVVHGVLLDDHRRPLEYWFTANDIDPLASVQRVGDIRKYAARGPDGHRQVFHIKRPTRVSQTRGITALAPIANTADQGDDLFYAQLIKAKVSACFAIIHNISDDAAYASLFGTASGDVTKGDREYETRPDGTTRPIDNIAPGIEMFGYPGEQILGFSPNVPNAEFFQHATLILSIVGINLDLPLCVLMLDASATNFSGFRGALDEARRGWSAYQRHIIRKLHRPYYAFRLRRKVASDPVLLAASKRSGINLYRGEWHPDGWDYIEPLKETTADLMQVRNAMISQRRRCNKRSIQWPVESRHIVEDNTLLIRQAEEKAIELRKEFAGDPEFKVDWREIACLPTPDGITMQLSPDPVDPSTSSVQESAHA